MDNLGIQVELVKNISVVSETLTRVGVRNNEEKKFYPSCYLVEDEGIYKLYHFKELFLKDGKNSTYNEVDEIRRNTIAYLIQNWGMIKIIGEFEAIQVQKIDVLSHKEKKNFKIIHKYLFKRKYRGEN